MVDHVDPREVVRLLKTCSWRYNHELALGDKIHYGLIAQDLLDTFGSEYGFVDTSGSYYRVNYTEFIGPLIACVQDQQLQLDQQEKRIADLEDAIKTIIHMKEST